MREYLANLNLSWFVIVIMSYSRLLLNRWAAVTHDILMIPAAWLLAYWLRFNLGSMPAAYFETALFSLIFIIPVQSIVFWNTGLYRGVWRFASIPDLLRILKSVFIGLILSIAILSVLFRMEGVPRSVPVLYAVLLMIFLGGPRLLYRWAKDRRLNLNSGKRVLIVGAGSAGEMLVRDMLRAESDGFQPVAFVDDKPRRIGQDIHGIPVVGSVDGIPTIVNELAIQVIVLAVPSATVKERKRLIDLCEQAKVPFRTVPQLDSLMVIARRFRIVDSSVIVPLSEIMQRDSFCSFT